MKNKGKRILSLLLVLVFVLSLSPVSFATGTTEEGQEPVPEVQTLEAGGEQAQSVDAPAQGGQEVPAAQGSSAETANSNQASPASEGAAEPVAPVSQEPVVETKGGELNAGTPVTETNPGYTADATGAGKTETTPTTETQIQNTNKEPSGNGTEDGKTSAEGASDEEGKGPEAGSVTEIETKTPSNSPATETAGETVKTEQSKEKQATGNQEVETVSKEQQPANEAEKEPAEKNTQPSAKSATSAAQTAVQAAPITKTAAGDAGVLTAPAPTPDYKVTIEEGSAVTSTEGSNTLHITGNGSVEIELNNTIAKSEKSIVFGDDDSSKQYSIIATLKGVVVAAREKLAGILVKANTTLTLLLSGESTVTGGDDHAGIEVDWTKQGDSPKYGSLTIDGEGTLNATGGSGSGGAGIGGSKGEQGVYGDITINGGTINATGTNNSAGIGSSQNPGSGTSHGSYKYIEDRWGKITIDGGTVNAQGNGFGAGIGGGNHSDSGEIVINGGSVNATGQSGIGSGYGSHQTTSFTDLTKGPGYYYADITINGGTIVATATSDGTTDAGGAGIGGGMYSDAKVTINGGNVTATGGNGKGLDSFHHGGSGIGGGYQGHAEVAINGGNVTAIGGGAAAGIGSGSIPNENPDNKGSQGYKSRMGETTVEQTEVSITGGTVTALGGVSGGAGVGGGVGADNISVSITGGNVTATGGLSNRDEQNKGMRGGAGIGSGYSGINSGESSKYFSTTNVDVTIDGDANVVATGGWGAAGIGSGAANKTAETIAIDVNNAQVRAFSDGTKFAIDSRDGEADIDVAGDLLQATFVFPYDDGGMDQDPTGLKKIIVTNDKTGETVKLITESDTVGMLKGYRSFATTVSEAGSYTVYTDEKSIGQGGGRYFGKGETEVRDPARPLSEMTRYTVTNGKLSDNHFLFPVKSIVVTKVVVAGGGLDKSTINNTCYFALWDRSKGEYVQRDGKTWIESIDIVNGVPQSRAIFADVNDSPEGGYGIWEVDQNGREEGIIGMTYGSYELRLVQTRHGDSGDNDAEIDDDNWTDEVSVINTYFPVPDPDPTPVPVGPFFPAEEIDEDEVPLALGSLTNQLGECFD